MTLPAGHAVLLGKLAGVGWAAEAAPERVGIAADKLPRLHLGHPREGWDEPWFVAEAYPVGELGVRTADEDTILIRQGLSHARKSGCAMCPFQPVGWYWALRETDPAGWEAVVEYERAALARNLRMFIIGQAPIGEVVATWRGEAPAIDGGGRAWENVCAVWGGGDLKCLIGPE